MSGTDAEDFEEGEALLLSFNHIQDLGHMQMKQEIHSLLLFSYKILHPNTVTMIPNDYLSYPLIH
jgi:hypothetical protein